MIKMYKDGMSCVQIGNKLGRDSKTVRKKLREVNIYVKKKAFSEEDEIYLAEHYPIGDWDGIFERFPSATKQSIQAKVSELGIRAEYYNEKRKWTNEELKILEEYYYTKSLSELCEMMNFRHSEDAILTKAFRKFGYSKSRKWTKEEDEILIKYYPIAPFGEVAEMLPRRTKNAIIDHAIKLNVKSLFMDEFLWKSDEIIYLMDHWKEYTDNELANKLGKTFQAVKGKRLVLGLLRQEHGNQNSYTNLSAYIRGQIFQWKKDSMANCGFKCVLTDSKDFEIHHIYPVNRLISDIFQKYNLVKKDFCDYSQEELDYIVDLFIKEQASHPLGVCVRSDIHSLYHSIYGNTTNCEKQWDKFVKEYKEGKYDNID